MGLFGSLFGKGIDAYVAQAQEAGAKLVDVREQSEFAQGHIPQAINIPVGRIESDAPGRLEKDETIYVYCQSGMRSSRACRHLQAQGYADVTNIGGISSYHGTLATGAE